MYQSTWNLLMIALAPVVMELIQLIFFFKHRTASSVHLIKFSPDGELFATAGQVRIGFSKCIRLYLACCFKYSMFWLYQNLSMSVCDVISGWLFGKSVVQHVQMAVRCHEAVLSNRTQLSREAGLFLHLPSSSALGHWLLLEENQQIFTQVRLLIPEKMIFPIMYNPLWLYRLFFFQECA